MTLWRVARTCGRERDPQRRSASERFRWDLRTKRAAYNALKKPEPEKPISVKVIYIFLISKKSVEHRTGSQWLLQVVVPCVEGEEMRHHLILKRKKEICRALSSTGEELPLALCPLSISDISKKTFFCLPLLYSFQSHRKDHLEKLFN
ncbi:hypothetical protein CEXT_456411 [Caerostris extrusa]|uniref:Ribosomal protein S10 n=1 Tax=Caerostris extrusa TaxID=172846 RepID=A0AAV4UYX8_CAEEX|nr:hypothetical protein CEXT_456411 [Caerostris extrusa]